MSTTFAPTNRLIPAIPPDLAVVCVVSLLGLVLSEAGLIIRFIRNDQRDVLFHRLTWIRPPQLAASSFQTKLAMSLMALNGQSGRAHVCPLPTTADIGQPPIGFEL